jgi:hypothetical protein
MAGERQLSRISRGEELLAPSASCGLPVLSALFRAGSRVRLRAGLIRWHASHLRSIHQRESVNLRSVSDGVGQEIRVVGESTLPAPKSGGEEFPGRRTGALGEQDISRAAAMPGRRCRLRLTILTSPTRRRCSLSQTATALLHAGRFDADVAALRISLIPIALQRRSILERSHCEVAQDSCDV